MFLQSLIESQKKINMFRHKSCESFQDEISNDRNDGYHYPFLPHKIRIDQNKFFKFIGTEYYFERFKNENSHIIFMFVTPRYEIYIAFGPDVEYRSQVRTGTSNIFKIYDLNDLHTQLTSEETVFVAAFLNKVIDKHNRFLNKKN